MEASFQGDSLRTGLEAVIVVTTRHPGDRAGEVDDNGCVGQGVTDLALAENIYFAEVDIGDWFRARADAEAT